MNEYKLVRLNENNEAYAITIKPIGDKRIDTMADIADELFGKCERYVQCGVDAMGNIYNILTNDADDDYTIIDVEQQRKMLEQWAIA